MKILALLLCGACLTLGAVSSAAVITDNFNDGDFTANPVWNVNGGTWDVTSQELRQRSATSGNSTGTAHTIQLNGVVAGSSFTMQTDEHIDAAANGNNAVGFAFRIQDSTHMYVAYLFPDYPGAGARGSMQIRKISGATRTLLFDDDVVPQTVQDMGYTPGRTTSTLTLSVVDNAFTFTATHGANTFTETFIDSTSPYTNGGVGLFNETYSGTTDYVGYFDNFSVNIPPVPEPASGMVAMLIAGLSLVRRKRTELTI